MEKIKTFRIMQYGNEIERVKANTEREALCIYLMNHEDLVDMMLWKSKDTGYGIWKLAEYDDEDNFMFAMEIKE